MAKLTQRVLKGLVRSSSHAWALLFYLAVLTNLGALLLVYVDGDHELIPLGIAAAAVNVTILFVIQAVRTDEQASRRV